MVMIETPSITGGTEQQQLQQMGSYLHRMAQQLQWAFDTLEAGAPSAAAPPAPVSKEKDSPKAVFAQIRDLIIKSADIVEAYSGEISKRLEGVYVAQSEFGTYRQETAQTLEAGSRGIRQLFQEQEMLQNTLQGLYDQTRAAEAYVKTGELARDEAGQPVYGLEIGQKNRVDGKEVFDRFARFTANRLSFFDASDVEVAYISDYKLCITNAEVSGSLTLSGRFRIWGDGGLIFQWTGGEKT